MHVLGCPCGSHVVVVTFCGMLFGELLPSTVELVRFSCVLLLVLVVVLVFLVGFFFFPSLGSVARFRFFFLFFVSLGFSLVGFG